MNQRFLLAILSEDCAQIQLAASLASVTMDFPAMEKAARTSMSVLQAHAMLMQRAKT